MIWSRKPVSLLKKTAVTLSVFSMCVSPLAQGAAAANQSKIVNDYLKGVGLTTTQPMTVGEYWSKVRHVYPLKLQTQMDQWVALNRREVMPKIQATTIKGSDGKQQVRLTLTKSGQTLNLTFTGDEDTPLKFNGAPISRKEMLNLNNFNDLTNKLTKSDARLKKELAKKSLTPIINENLVLNIAEFKKLTARQKAEYFVRLRRTIEAAQKVFIAKTGAQAELELEALNKKYEWVVNFLFGQPAEAQGRNFGGQACIVAGYITQYGSESNSCGGRDSGARDLAAQVEASRATNCGGEVACNPLVYGYTSNGGAHCAPRNQVNRATANCNRLSPLQVPGDALAEAQNKKRIIESYLRTMRGQNVDLVLNAEGKISEAQLREISTYLGELQRYIAQADAMCATPENLEVQASRPDQAEACAELRIRAIALTTFATAPEPIVTAPPPRPPVSTATCEDIRAGSRIRSTAAPVAGADEGVASLPPIAGGGAPTPSAENCVCPEGTNSGQLEGREACVPGAPVVAGGTGVGGRPEGADSQCQGSTWECNKSWMIPVGLGLLGLGIFAAFYFGNKTKKTSPVYVPPAPVDPDAPVPTPSPTTPIDEPPIAPCPAPNTLVNGICTPPVVVPPVIVTPTEGGTRVDDGPPRATR